MQLFFFLCQIEHLQTAEPCYPKLLTRMVNWQAVNVWQLLVRPNRVAYDEYVVCANAVMTQ